MFGRRRAEPTFPENGWPVQKLDELLPWAWAEQNGASLAA